MERVVVVTVTYGKRWKFLSRVVESVIHDPHLHVLIIVDNASPDAEHIKGYSKKHEGKVIILRNEKNVGSAGGFHQGLAKARELDCDFVLILDDDNVLEEGGINMFLKRLQMFGNKEHVALAGRRMSTDAGLSVFYNPPKVSKKVPSSFFNVFGVSKVKNLFNIFSNKKAKVESVEENFHPVVEIESFAFGGSFLPIEAVRKATLPQSKLFLYGDDIEYSWNVREAGYRLYACDHPFIQDIDETFHENESHLTGLFSESTSDFKVYFRMRNMVLISMQRTKGVLKKAWLILNVLIWIVGLFVIVYLKGGMGRGSTRKSRLILRAVWNGLIQNTELPKDLSLPGNAMLA